MNPIPQQLLISGTVLFLLSLLAGFVIPAVANPRMAVSAHIAGLEGGLALWALGLMWHRLTLPPGAERAAEILAVLGLFAIFVSTQLAAMWGASRALPIAGAGHQATPLREAIVYALIAGGSLAITVAIALVLWGLIAWKG